MIANKDAQGTWHSTQATVLALKALIAGTGTALGDNQERHITLHLGDRLLKDLRIPAEQDDVMQSIDITPFLAEGTSASSLRLTQLSGADVTYQVSLRYNTPSTPSLAAAPQKSLDISLAYDRTTLSLGALSPCHRYPGNFPPPNPLPMILLDLPHPPPGFTADTASLDTLQTANRIEKYQCSPPAK